MRFQNLTITDKPKHHKEQQKYHLSDKCKGHMKQTPTHTPLYI